MIAEQGKIKVTISNNGTYYRNLGYGSCKQREVVLVTLSDLPKQSNKKVLCSCDECRIGFRRQYQLVSRQSVHRCYSCERKFIGITMNRTKIDAATRSRIGSKHPRWNPDTSAFKKYAGSVHYQTKKVYEVCKGIINPENHPRTLCGVEGGYQLDHKVSVKEGFDNKLPVHEVAQLNNLQMIPWQENRKKGVNRHESI